MKIHPEICSERQPTFYNYDWSPEQISGALKLQGICVSHETIYRKIYAEIRAKT